jgi:uncharacterized Zn finger protein/superfamily II DNA or RNA helicase
VAKIKFAETWWGESWIRALEEIDVDTNRLPRGRTYARNGSVLEIKRTRTGTIQARVQGRRPAPYRIRIALTEWSEEQNAAVLDLIQNSPALSSQLLIGQMPESLEAELEKLGARIFPSSWREMTASCSCPDWANPCKHLAAVYYLLAVEIDKDPFLLFEMRGLKKKRILETARLTDQTLKSAGWVFDVSQTPVTDTYEAPTPTTEEIESYIVQPYPIDKALGVLEKNPRFDDGPLILQLLPTTYRKIRDYWNGEAFIEPEEPLAHSSSITIEHREEGPVFLVDELYKKEVSELTVADFLFRMEGVSLSPLAEDHATMRWVKDTLSLARRLIALNSWVPVLYSVGQGEDFGIRYAPVYSQPTLRQKKVALNASVPTGLIHDAKNRPLKREQSVDYLLSVFLTQMVQEPLDGVLPYSSIEMARVFFLGEVYKADHFQRQQTKTAVQNWLTPLHLSDSEHNLVLDIQVTKKTQFSLTVSVKRKRDLFIDAVPMQNFLKTAANGGEKEGALKQLACLSEWIPPLKRSFEERTIPITVDELIQLLSQARDFLGFFGAELVVPKEFKDLTRPRVFASARMKSERTKGVLNFENLLQFEWRVQFGEDNLSIEEFAALMKGAERIVLFKDQYCLVDPIEAKRMVEKYMTSPIISGPEGLRAVFAQELDGYPLRYGEDVERLLKGLRKERRCEAPGTLNGQLRPYQLKGYQWMLSNLHNGFNICLADDMGLGKTIQVIAVLLKLRENKELTRPALVICPASVTRNWRKEIETFAPDLKCELYGGSNREISAGKDVWITTYGMVRSEVERLKSFEWSVVIVDEAQNIKNPDADKSKAIAQLNGQYKIAMSGTPVENRVAELWSLFNFIMPGYLGPRKKFREEFAIPIERLNDPVKTKTLKQAVEPFLLRRLKSDKNIIKDLPEKVVREVYVTLKPEQAALYGTVLEAAVGEIESAQGIKRKGKVFWLLTALKQICNHPVSYTKSGTPVAEHSGKSEKAFELLKEVIKSGEKALLFTQYREMGALLAAMTPEKLGIDPLFFHGGLTPKERENLILDFQQQPYHPLMIITLKAGGTGLNLTAATTVIHYDLWWNPAVENQATDRSYRIGQKKSVTVHRLLTENTFEERVNELLQKKKELSDAIVGAGEHWITEMSNEEIRSLFEMKTT